MDRDENEKTLNVDNSLCNQKENILVTDHAQITEKSALPISTIKYGPLPNESAKISDASRELISREFPRMNFEIILENEFPFSSLH